jgi:hypothetical protein
MMTWAQLQKYFWNILKCACSIAFIIQISASIKSQLAPSDTVAKTVRTNLSMVDFPVVFKVCMKPSFNDDELKKVGYEFAYSYFSGKSRYEENITGIGLHGWAGHTENGGVFSNVADVQNRIFHDYHAVIDSTLIITKNHTVKTLSTSSYQLRKPNYPNNCLTLDITNDIPPGEEIAILSLKFNSGLFATDIDVVIEDKLTVVDRTSLSSIRNQPINYDNLRKNLTKTYLVSFKQNIFQDKESTFCVNYPTDHHKSFIDCDNQYLEELLQKVDLYPSWATPLDLSRATNLTRSAGLGQAILYFLGYDSGPCVEPCTQTSIKTVYKLANMMTIKGVTYPAIILNFNPMVEVITHALPIFNPLDVLQV